jgi:hypothetical protein
MKPFVYRKLNGFDCLVHIYHTFCTIPNRIAKVRIIGKTKRWNKYVTNTINLVAKEFTIGDEKSVQRGLGS